MGFFDLMPGRYDYLVDALEGLNRGAPPLVGFNATNNVWTITGSGDDLGLYIAVPQLAKLTNLPIALCTDIFLSICLAIGVTVALFLTYSRWQSTFVRIVAFGHIVCLAFVAYFVGDVYMFQVVAVLIAAPLAFIITGNTRSLGTFWLSLLFFLVGTVFFSLNEFRSASGTLGLVIVGLSLALEKKLDVMKKASLLTALMVGFIPVKLCHDSVVNARNQYLSSVSVDFNRGASQKHVLWHSVYIGFGFLSNPYNITYSDGVATRLVMESHPGVIVPGNDLRSDYAEYENILMTETFRLIRDHPYFVIRTYAAKFGVVLLFIFISFPIGLFFYKKRRPKVLDAIFLSGAVVGFLPALLVMPMPKYMAGGIAVTMFYSFACFAYSRENY